MGRSFQPLYAAACKTAYRFELLSGNETQDYAFEFLKKLPYKVLVGILGHGNS